MTTRRHSEPTTHAHAGPLAEPDRHAPGKGTVYWHILMGGYPKVRSLAQEAQNQLTEFPGLHMTPLDWLHISTLVVGSTEQVTPDHMQGMLKFASRSLAHVAPIDISLGRILYHPEAIMLGVDPAGALDSLLDAARTAAQAITGQDGSTTSGAGPWVPHMTLCYSVSQQPAGPLVSSLGLSLRPVTASIDTLTLVVQHGPERQWDWRPVGNIILGQ